MIQVSNLSKNYKNINVLKDINFIVSPGNMLAIVGANGCGKSTLLQILSGVISYDSGQITYFGQSMNYRQHKLFAKYCGYLPQTNGLLEELSVADNLSLWTGNRSSMPDDLIKDFNLNEILHKPVKQLSGGMKRRVAIACAMANYPPILLMDEPTAAIDKMYRDVIHKFMLDYLTANGTIIIATHDSEEIAMAHEVIDISR